jgi:hypothetical protein
MQQIAMSIMLINEKINKRVLYLAGEIGLYMISRDMHWRYVCLSKYVYPPAYSAVR